MTIKNETAFTKECMEGAMRACEAGNSRYKTFKLIYKLFGIIFGLYYAQSRYITYIWENGRS